MSEQSTAPVQPAVSDPLRRHRLDLSAMEGGKWVEIRGDKWLVASYSAKAVADARAEAMVEAGLKPEEDVPPHLRDKVAAHIFARAILRGCKLKDAPALAYSTDLGERIYRDPELIALRTELQNAAMGDYTRDEVAKASVLGNC
jgi:hypothetical protein